MDKDDIVLAFFPCTRFEDQILLWFRGENYAQRNWQLKEKMEKDLELHKELAYNYELITELFIVCINKGLKLIFENPYSEQHYLYRYWCFKPSIIDMDRRESGDYFKKPTQYWFLNCEPKNNFIFEPQNWNAIECKDAIVQTSKCFKDMGANSRQTARSMIHPDYANRFIRQYIL